ncbi:dienelactone hydrolase family protein [Paenibacillus glycanilyticus]|uniref:dienelactone hydrolase family protein n=1 Tax=Paenibacillus glycanilyticus TaxID=126569 RepID=UPI00203C73B4|nr:dienelactone hydrolase family protein [Paenibacillus glycanilyticus]MCM3628511.1 dienelactone hydrolase family protein [Paenibacillus glycanilyticus]
MTTTTMIEIRNRSEDAILVVHEIYGLNNHLSSICSALAKHGYDVFGPDLLNRGEPFPYEQEQEAYSYFMSHVGFEKAASTILQLAGELKHRYRNVYVVGFSVGATAAWMCSTNPNISGAAGYYGSRIRSYKEIIPACPALLFYPESEPSFDVDQLIADLQDKPGVQVHKSSGQHGFSDPYSAKYVQASADEAFGKMLHFFKSIG